MAYRVVADHIRTLTIAITDGAQPGNDGRNYVIRRILRRGVRYAKQYLYPAGTTYEAGFFSGLTAKVVELLGDAFPELKGNPGTGMTPEKVSQVILEEELSFLKTLDRGIAQFEKFAAEDKATGTVSGPHAFMLYDTFGFPIDLTLLMAEEKGLKVDSDGYNEAMEKQRAKSRGEAKEGEKVLVLEAEQTDKLAKELNIETSKDADKYSWMSSGSGPKLAAVVKAMWDGKNFLNEAPEGAFVGLILDQTNYYAEAGGQLFDTGRITSDSSICTVENCQKFGGYILHTGTVGSGVMKVGDAVECDVDYERRSLIAANHTSTHLLNWALREVLKGHQIDQRGSIVAPDKLRFDFSYGKPMKIEEVQQVQTLVRGIISAECELQTQEVSLSAAKQIKSLRAVFGEVYPDPVRVVSVGPVKHTIDELLSNPESDEWQKLSVEFCGGTHMDNTKEAATFSVIQEEGTAKGVRRLVCVTKTAAAEAQHAANEFMGRVKGADSIADMKKLDEEISKLRTDIDAITMDYVGKDECKKAIDKLKEKVLAAEKEMAKAKADAAVKWAESMDVAGKNFIVDVVDVNGDAKAIDAAMKAINTKVPDVPVCFISKAADKVAALAVVPKACADKMDAKDWLNSCLEKCGGKGGGKPDRAQGAAKDPSNFDAAVAAAREYAQSKLG